MIKTIDDIKATDTEIALNLAYHIENPCSTAEIGAGSRSSYIQMAENLMKDMKNPYAIRFLEITIDLYK